MKNYRIILVAVFLTSIAFIAQLPAQNQTKSGAPAIPVPTGDVRKAAPKPGSPPKIQIGKAVTNKLANGLTVIVVENHKLPRVSFRVFADYDPVQEKEAAGYVQMMGELLSKGTKTRTKAQIDEAVDFIGATLSSDGNGVSGACLSKHSDKQRQCQRHCRQRRRHSAVRKRPSLRRNNDGRIVGQNYPGANPETL
ncbi:MAG: hypothetical protein L6Q97_15320 [Thermoanaerobaculia bacterium]|nr:hypothetical protein [Thermoanaerobaculia bacterium]